MWSVRERVGSVRERHIIALVVLQVAREVLSLGFVLPHHVLQLLLLVAQLLAQHALLSHAAVHLVVADHSCSKEKNISSFAVMNRKNCSHLLSSGSWNVTPNASLPRACCEPEPRLGRSAHASALLSGDCSSDASTPLSRLACARRPGDAAACDVSCAQVAVALLLTRAPDGT